MHSRDLVDLHLDLDGRHVRLSPGRHSVLGRGQDCDVTLLNTQVSRRHAEFAMVEGAWVVRDLGSSNGTFVDGRRVEQPVRVRPGGRVQLGGPRGVTIRVGFAPTHRYDEGHLTAATESMPVNASMTDATGPVRLPHAAPRAPEQRRPAGDVFHRYDVHTGDSAGPGRPSQAQSGPLTVLGASPQVIPTAADAMTIGRGLDNEIVIKDLLASRRHARLVPSARGFDVEDLGSRNGTYVNGSRVTRGVLREGDLLAVGRTRFTVKNGALVASEDEGDVSFVAHHLSFTLPDGTKLLDDVSFGLEGSSLVAVIGPSGAGKSTLLKALIGTQRATEGEVYYDGRDLYDNFDDLRHRIGVVPQDDVVHSQLTVRQALRYAAELRFPDDLDKALRDERVEEVIAELGLAGHAQTQVAKLSGGQRKRTSVALELLTRPSLLFLDEPTSGLDPGLDKRVMLTLRGLADGGRTVVVITHNVASLRVCDRVLMLAPGGRVAFFGPPEEMLPFFSAADHADVFNAVTDDPVRAQHVFAASPLMDSHVAGPLSAPRSRASAAEETAHRQQSIPRQPSTLIRRQVRVVLADRGFVAFMLALPVALACLAMLVPGEHGLHTVRFADEAARAGSATAVMLRPESSQIMTLLIMGSVFMGLAMTIRELVAERAIYLREKAVGLSAFSYLGSKVISSSAFVAVQCAIMVGIIIAVKGAPDAAVVLGSPVLETFTVCVLTAVASIGAGLMLSSLARTSEQVMPMLVVAIMGALVFSGGLFDLDTAPMRWAASVFPSRWGLAMGTQTADVVTSLTVPSRSRAWDPFWPRDHATWVLAAEALGIQFVVSFAVAWWNTHRRRTM